MPLFSFFYPRKRLCDGLCENSSYLGGLKGRKTGLSGV
jgi:hypothetical protein